MKYTIILLACANVLCATQWGVGAAPAEVEARPISVVLSDGDVSKLDNDDNNDILFNYNPIEPKFTNYVTKLGNNNIKSDSYTGGLERELDVANKKSSVVTGPAVREVLSTEGQKVQSPNADQVRDIALNSREVRLVGPNQREVEMKDDLPTKFVVAMENLQKEATDVWGQVNEKLDKGWTDIKRSEVWGQVNDKLDKGWTDLKKMVEGVVAPATKPQAARNP